MYKLDLGHRFKHSLVYFPEYNEAISKIKHFYHDHGCRKFVLGLGQWPASFWAKAKFGKPSLFDNYLGELKAVIRNEELYEIGDGDIEIYLRNVHWNPIGDVHSECSATDEAPKDWRSITLMDGYNYLIKSLVEDT